MVTLFILILVFIVLAIALVIFLLKNDRGKKEPVYALWMAAGFGILGAVAATLIEKALIPLSSTRVGTPLPHLLFSFLGIGLIEESLKFLPLAIVLFPKKYFNEHIDGIIYFAIAGLSFGLPENILYTMQFGTKAGLGRLIMTPIFHAALTSMAGYYLAKAKLAGRSPFTIWPVFIAAVLLHGLYDFGLTSGVTVFTYMSVIITIALSASFFHLYFRSQELDEDMGLSAVGHNEYCRACGFKNSQHYLYCTHCGQRA
jgi:RsiW-degrading membrane proteinase PrsW (M82 family)